MNESVPFPSPKKATSIENDVRIIKLLRPILGIVVLLFILFRFYPVLVVQHEFGPDTWTRLLISGLIIGGVYALIAIGYTLVYGILFMINFAHGEVMMFGAYAGFFAFQAFKAIKISSRSSDKFHKRIPCPCNYPGISYRYDSFCYPGLFPRKDCLSPSTKSSPPGAAHQRHWSLHLPPECRPVAL